MASSLSSSSEAPGRNHPPVQGEILLERLDLQAADNFRSRKILTQVRVLQNALTSIVPLLAIAHGADDL